MFDGIWDIARRHLALALTGYVLAVTWLRVGFTARWDWNLLGALLAAAPPFSVLLTALTAPALAIITVACLMPAMLARQRGQSIWPQILWVTPLAVLALALIQPLGVTLLAYPLFIIIASSRLPRPPRVNVERGVLLSQQVTADGVFDELEESGESRRRALQRRFRTANLALFAAMTLFVLMYPIVWMPLESIDHDDDRTVGFVIDVSDGWATVMTNRPRSLAIIASAEVTGRTPCVADGRHPRTTLLQTVRIDTIPVAEYPDCDELDADEGEAEG